MLYERKLFGYLYSHTAGAKRILISLQILKQYKTDSTDGM